MIAADNCTNNWHLNNQLKAEQITGGAPNQLAAEGIICLLSIHNDWFSHSHALFYKKLVHKKLASSTSRERGQVDAGNQAGLFNVVVAKEKGERSSKI